ncbi:putative reverse transcriptase domain-containing protein, partial [Tanacetum coccineum]
MIVLRIGRLLSTFHREFFSRIAKPLALLTQKNRNEIRYHPRNANVVADALSKASKVENATAKMLCGLDQLMERKEDEVDRLTKSAHFLAIREDYKMEKLARLYIDEIVAGHGVRMSIISDHDRRFTSRFLANITESLRDAIRYEYGLSSLDGWTNYHSSIRCALFEALYGRKCRSPVLWAEIGESRLIGPELVQETTDKVILIKERLKAARDCQNSYVGNMRKQLGFEVGDKVILEVSSWKGVKYLADVNLRVPVEEIKVDKTLRFVEEPVEIIDREVKSLKCSRILIVKVHWNSKRGYKDFIKTRVELWIKLLHNLRFLTSFLEDGRDSYSWMFSSLIVVMLLFVLSCG